MLAEDGENRLQADLDAVFRGATSVKVLSELEDVPGKVFLQRRTLATVTDPAAIRELHAALRIASEGCGHCMCMGEEALEIEGPAGSSGEITLHHGQSIRWEARWEEDAALLDGARVVAWLAKHGAPEAQERRAADAKRAAETNDELARWLAAAPRCFPEATLRAFVGAPWDPVDELAALLEQACPVASARVMLLLAWFGFQDGPWSGYGAHEDVAANLLERESDDWLTHLPARPDLKPQHLEGAARFVHQRPHLVQQLTPALRKRFIEHLSRSRHENKRRAYGPPR